MRKRNQNKLSLTRLWIKLICWFLAYSFQPRNISVEAKLLSCRAVCFFLRSICFVWRHKLFTLDAYPSISTPCNGKKYLHNGVHNFVRDFVFYLYFKQIFVRYHERGGVSLDETQKDFYHPNHLSIKYVVKNFNFYQLVSTSYVQRWWRNLVKLDDTD